MSEGPSSGESRDDEAAEGEVLLVGEDDALDTSDALPVVARLVVEIRSDGSTTIARGAVEDLLNGETVAMEARAGSPVELAGSLAKMLLQTPLMATRALWGGRTGESEGERPSRVRRLAGGVAERILARAGRRRSDD